MSKKKLQTNISGVSEGISESIKKAAADEAKAPKRLPFSGKRIAVSVSASEDLAQLGLSEHHVKDVTVELARYLLVNGAKLLYGGDLRKGGYTEIFAKLSEQYTRRSDEEKYFVNYFPFPNSNALTTDVRAKFSSQRVDIKELKPPKQVGRLDLDRLYEPFASAEDRYIFAECFADMRQTMADDCDVRIVVGGQLTSYLGYFPGIVEEAYYTLKADKPVYVVGGFGGSSARIVEVMSGNRKNVLEGIAGSETDLIKEFREVAAASSKADIEFPTIESAFAKYTQKRAAKKMGLSEDEAAQLLVSTNVHEIVFLIVKGLQKVLTKN